jgi:hypothetical protein
LGTLERGGEGRRREAKICDVVWSTPTPALLYRLLVSWREKGGKSNEILGTLERGGEGRQKLYDRCMAYK